MIKSITGALLVLSLAACRTAVPAAADKKESQETTYEQQARCQCEGELTDATAQLALERRLQSDVDPADRQMLEACISQLRAETLRALDADEDGTCDDELDRLEGIAHEDAMRLAEWRDEVSEQLKLLSTNHERASRRLEDIKEGLRRLSSIYIVTGTTVDEVANAYTKARDKVSKEADNKKFTDNCENRWAYVSLEEDEAHFKDLIRCAEHLHSKIREGTTAAEIRELERKFNLSIARFEQRLRGVGRAKTEKLKDLQTKHDAAEDKEEQKELDSEMDVVKEQIAKIDKVVAIPGAHVQPEFTEYEQYFNKFYAGYEYVSLDEAFGKGFLRVGAMLGFHYPRLKVPAITGRNWYPFASGVYNIFSVGLSNTAESSDVTPPDGVVSGSAMRMAPLGINAADDPNPSDAPKDPKRALEFEGQFFAPVWRNDFHPEARNLRNYIGPLVVVGAKYGDDDDFATHRIYGGLRVARSPEQYYDVLYGRTGNLRSRRLEVRGQFPVIRLGNGSRFILGAIGNFGVSDEKKGISCGADDTNCTPRDIERDRLRLYISWDVPISNIFSAFGGFGTNDD